MSFMIQDIEKAVCVRFKLTPKDMRSPARQRPIARPRQIAMYLARELTQASYPQIGRHFGGRDHTTALHGKRKIERMIRESNLLGEYIHEVRQLVSTLPTFKQRVSGAALPPPNDAAQIELMMRCKPYEEKRGRPL